MIEKILALDSLVNTLSIYERAWLQKQRFYNREKVFDEAPVKILFIKKIIEQKRWSPPVVKFNPAKELVWFGEKDCWRSIETYQHSILEEIINLKLNK